MRTNRMRLAALFACLVWHTGATGTTVTSSTTTSTATSYCPSGFIEALIDFEGLPVGSAPTELCFTKGLSGASYGASVCIDLVTSGENNGALIFDAACGGPADGTDNSGCTGGDQKKEHKSKIKRDTDLFQPMEGNVLILQRDGNVSRSGKNKDNVFPSSLPDDDMDGGCFTFIFNTSSFLMEFSSITVADAVLIDIEETNEVTFTAYPSGATTMSSITEDGGIQTVDLDFANVQVLDICLPGSGAVGDVALCLEPRMRTTSTSTTTSTTSSTVTSSGTTSTSTSSTTVTDDMGQNIDPTDSSSTSTTTSIANVCPSDYVQANVDFEGLGVGSAPTKLCFSEGITGTGYGASVCIDLETSGPNAGALIFDAACGGPADGTDNSGCTGGDQKKESKSKIKRDTDLFQPMEGNVLILQRDGNVSRSGKNKDNVFPSSLPDDDMDGGCFKFIFNTSSFLKEFSSITVANSVLIDIEETKEVTFKAYPSGDSAISGITEDGGIQTVNLDFANVLVLDVCLAGSGAVADLTLCLLPIITSSTTSTTTSSFTTSTLSSSSTSTTTATEDIGNSFDPCPSGYSPATIDFENLAVGSQPTKLCFDAGISSSQTDVMVDDSVCIDLATDGKNNGAMIFDAACGGPADGTDDSGCTGGDQKPDDRSKIKRDTDLFQPQEGNVLILQRDGNVSKSGKLKNNVFPLSLPDDDMDGGCFYFSFNTSSFLKKFASVIVTDSVLLDIEQGLVQYHATLQDGVTRVARSGLTEDGGIQTVQLHFADVVALEICLRRSGALGDIGLCLEPQTTTSTSTTTSTTSSTVTSSGSTSTSTTTTTVTDEFAKNIDNTESSSTTTSTATVVCPGDFLEATLDFENLPVGSAPKKLCFSEGITASGFNVDGSVCIDLETTGRNNGALIFDATCDGDQNLCSGADTDLYQPAEGNVLILQQNNQAFPSSIPNDDRNGGCFQFFFNTTSFSSKFSSVYVASATLLDIEENPVNFTAYEKGDMARSAVIADGDITTTELKFEEVAMLEICLPGSGAVGDIVVCLDRDTTTSTSTTTSTTSSTVTSSGTTSTSTSSTTVTDVFGQNIDPTVSSSTSTSTSTGVCPVGFVSATIDFENLNVGSQPEKVCFSKGISGLSYPTSVCVDLETDGPNNGAMIFDAACGGPADGTDDSGCTGGDQKPDDRSKIKRDVDLFHPMEGNVLILQRDGNVSRSGKMSNFVFPSSLPDDDGDGGCFTFSFNTTSFLAEFSSVFVASSVLMDIEEKNVVDFTAYTQGGGMVTAKSGATENGGIQTVDLNFEEVLVLKVCMAGSGAVNDIELCLEEKDDRRLEEHVVPRAAANNFLGVASASMSAASSNKQKQEREHQPESAIITVVV